MDRSTRDIPAAIDVIRRAEALHQKLLGAKLAMRWQLDLTGVGSELLLRGASAGDPLERLADAVLRSAIESGLERYRRWLLQLARGNATFPEQQLGHHLDESAQWEPTDGVTTDTGGPASPSFGVGCESAPTKASLDAIGERSIRSRRRFA
jgi:hypothetical protein